MTQPDLAAAKTAFDDARAALVASPEDEQVRGNFIKARDNLLIATALADEAAAKIQAEVAALAAARRAKLKSDFDAFAHDVTRTQLLNSLRPELDQIAELSLKFAGVIQRIESRRTSLRAVSDQMQPIAAELGEPMPDLDTVLLDNSVKGGVERAIKGALASADHHILLLHAWMA